VLTTKHAWMSTYNRFVQESIFILQYEINVNHSNKACLQGRWALDCKTISSNTEVHFAFSSPYMKLRIILPSSTYELDFTILLFPLYSELLSHHSLTLYRVIVTRNFAGALNLKVFDSKFLIFISLNVR